MYKYTMEMLVYHGLEADNFIKENNINKICQFNLFCCQIYFYKNAKYYFHCYYYKNNCKNGDT